MSHLTSPYINCPNLQGALNDWYPNCSTVPERLPFLEFVLSSVNRAGVTIPEKTSPGGGKTRIAEVIYTPRVLEGEVSEVITRACTNENVAGQIAETYEIDPDAGVEISEKFAPEDMRAFCEDNQRWFEQRIMAMIDGALRKLETRTMGQLPALAGAFATNDTDGVAANVKTVQTMNSGMTALSNDLIKEVKFSAVQAGYCSIPYVFGEGNTTKYMTDVMSGCCFDYGIDLGDFAAKNPFVYFDSYRVGDAFGTDRFVTLAAGAVQLLTFAQYPAGALGVTSDTSHRIGTIRDPRFGLEWDFLLKNDCGTVYVTIALATKLVGLPTDIFSDGDRLRGVTYVNEFLVSNS